MSLSVDDEPTMVTYKRADGEPICGEYAFVTGLEWFDMDDQQTELVEEGWVRVSVAKVWAGRPPTPDEDDA